MIRNRLKTETRPQHEKLDTGSFASALSQGTLTLEAYKQMLGRWYGFYLPLEQVLEANPDWAQLDSERRRKLPALVRDLTYLGMDEASIQNLPLCQNIPTLENSAQVFGTLYVIEGSSLGGQIISRMLKSSLNLEPESGSAFFSGYGEDTSPMWKSFIEVLEARPEEEHDTIVESAKDTFTKIDQWLSVEATVGV
jgi:heme oxygenase (biliverdin-IX-beta and delta-forming)